VVEDEQLVAMDIQRRLIQLGHQVVGICDRAQTALEATHQFHPDLVLMDIHLKGEINGITTAIQIQQYYHLPIVFLTAHADQSTVTQAKNIQPFGYLVKPVQTNHLNTAIDIALARHQAETGLRQALEKQRDLNAALQQALEREQELSNLKSQFVSIISHEFRNPLSSIILTLDLLERHGAKFSSEEQLHHIHRAKEASNYLVQLVEDVITLRQTEAPQFHCQPSPVDVTWFCRELINEFKMKLITPHTILFTLNSVPGNEPSFHNLDIKLLRHILDNLLSNAIKYSPSGGEINFDLVCEPDKVTFRIQDHGIGISPEDQQHLFTPFHRGSNAGLIPGTGLGLSLVLTYFVLSRFTSSTSI
jgi:signal transduction histidine kinase